MVTLTAYKCNYVAAHLGLGNYVTGAVSAAGDGNGQILGLTAAERACAEEKERESAREREREGVREREKERKKAYAREIYRG